MLSDFDMVIFLGSSNLLYSCARKTRQFYGTDLNIKIIETSYSVMKRRYIPEFGEIGALPDKKSILNFLRALDGRILLFSINNPYILTKDLCEKKNLVMVNLHHALLPVHPGRNAEAWTIYEQDTEGGCTWHYISADVDAGAIILQEKTPVTVYTTSILLLKQCELLALKSFERFLPFERIEVYAARQTIMNKQTVLPKKSTEIPNNGILDLAWGFSKQLAFLNAMNYGAAQVLGKPKIFLDGKEYEISSYKYMDSRHPDWNGSLNNLTENNMILKNMDEKIILRLINKD